MKLFTNCFFMFLVSTFSWSQVTNEGLPKSWDKSIEMPNEIEMPSFNLKELQEEDALVDGTGTAPWRFGFDFVVDYNLFNSGKWTTLPNGDRIWQIRFYSEGAKTMNFVLNEFYMPNGANLYIYNVSKTDLLGAYDAQQNNEHNSLGTWLVQGDDIVLEYFEPKNIAGQGRLSIAKVVHGYRTQNDFEKGTNDLNDSGNCNLDVECSIGALDNLKNHNKKSVALLLSNNNSFCSGALINNTANDGKRYVLTANHCYSNPANWAFRFNWISENPVCATTQNSTNNNNYNQTISGATLKARRSESDFCLVEINNAFPTNWDLVWAGWDRSLTPATASFGIHHPAGDIMKTCLDNNAPISLNLTNGDRTWEVSDWDLGVTEGGSSGSPLFNQNGLITGQLWRGDAACNGTTDNNQEDEYGRLNVSWDAGTTSSTRLKEWLDPSNTGVQTLQPFPSLVTYALDAAVTLTDIPTEITCEQTVTPSVLLKNQGTTTLISAVVSYDYNNGVSGSITWSGSLLSQESEAIPLPSLGILTGTSQTIDISVSNPNAGTDLNTNNDSQSVSIANSLSVYETSSLQLSLLMDNYADEVSWLLEDENGTALYSSTSFSSSDNNQLITETFALSSSGCYNFTINDSEGDGICCFYGNGNYQLTTAEGIVIISGGNFGSSESVNFKTDALSSDLLDGTSFQLYPNPAKSSFVIETTNDSTHSYTVFSLLGQEIAKGTFLNSTTVSSTNYASGVYIVKVKNVSNGTSFSQRVIVSK